MHANPQRVTIQFDILQRKMDANEFKINKKVDAIDLNL